MELTELQKMGNQRRLLREGALALALGGSLLALFLILPPQSPVGDGVATETPPPAPNAFADLPIQARAAIVYDLSTRSVLYARNENAQLPLASLTKLLTVYAALEKLPKNASVTIGVSAAKTEAPRAFKQGETLALGDLARLTLTASLNDGAAAIVGAAAEASGSIPSSLLAGAAASLDLSQTFALNGSGLDINTEISGGYGSARDIAILAGALVEAAPDTAHATTLPKASAVSEKGILHTVKNTDPLVSTFPHLLLSKTGFTDLAGGNLALVFDVGINHPIAVVVLGSFPEARFSDGETLAAATLAHFAGVESL